ncbi:MAG: hypothetical protein IPL79_20360 [Myxococcales bacterium]|nr:hypothetical protein [Myxococcales bacterium]
MDFGKYDSRTAAETPIRMQIKAQSTGEPISDGKKPCIVLVKGASSRSAQAVMRAEEAARMKKAKGKKTDEEAMDIQKSLGESAARFVTGFEGVQRKDQTTGELRDITASSEDCAWFFDLNMFSLPHLMRAGNGITRKDDEDEDAFEARRDAEMAEWLKPSFAQQVIDAAREDDAFLGATAKG